MAEVKITLNEDDVHAACREWAVTKVLNEGRATDSEIHVVVCSGKPNGTLTSVSVRVENERTASLTVDKPET